MTETPRDTERKEVTLLTDADIFIFNEGSHFRLYDKLGAHPLTVDGVTGTYFAVWAPNAQRVFVIGDFNHWDKTSHPLERRADSGIWEGFLPGIEPGTVYKYHIISRYNNYRVDKADPFAMLRETPPETASVVCDVNDYAWGDRAWMEQRYTRNNLDDPLSIYEMHLGSWMRGEESHRFLTYRELAPCLTEYLQRMGFTHVEFMPVMEHPFYGSWGYQVVSFFAPTSRYGTPQDFMYLIDYLHQHNIGVILDWVPSHFPKDEHGLGYFDGTCLFEHADPRQGYHPEWNSAIFNYGRNEVRCLLISSALFWLDKYHVDGLRVDGVASMIYLDYARKPGEWVPNKHGGNENLEAVEFLRILNQEVYKNYPDVQTIAEESTSWPMVSRPTYLGGLGFGMKWDMGWMHDTLNYMSRDPIFRKFHHNEITFRLLYAFTENYMLPLSHDEVVYGKQSLIGKMPGDEWQRFANLRLLFGFMYGQPGKKLVFMGGEFGQWHEWNHDASLDWHLTHYPLHSGLQQWVADLNQFYRSEPALYEYDNSAAGFEWVDANDTEHSVYSFIRRGKSTDNLVLVLYNGTPVPQHDYRVGVPRSGYWREALNSDAVHYGGSGHGNMGGVTATGMPFHGRPDSVLMTLPPLSVVFLQNTDPLENG